MHWKIAQNMFFCFFLFFLSLKYFQKKTKQVEIFHLKYFTLTSLGVEGWKLYNKLSVQCSRAVRAIRIARCRCKLRCVYVSNFTTA